MNKKKWRENNFPKISPFSNSPISPPKKIFFFIIKNFKIKMNNNPNQNQNNSSQPQANLNQNNNIYYQYYGYQYYNYPQQPINYNMT